MALRTGSRLAVTMQDVSAFGCPVPDSITEARDDDERTKHRTPAAAETALSWDYCARRVADDYRVSVDRAGRSGRLRYVAVAHSLSVRPYAVVTSDPAELLLALGCTDIAMAAAAREAVR